MNFDGDAFISYSPLDNVALKEGGKGWIGPFTVLWKPASGNFSVSNPSFGAIRNLAATTRSKTRVSNASGTLQRLSRLFPRPTSSPIRQRENWSNSESRGSPGRRSPRRQGSRF